MKAMKKVSMTVIGCFFLFLLASASSAFVDIQKGKTNDVEYMTGGVGIGERQAMEEMAKGYNLKMVFAKVEGNYLADIPVAIMKPTGEKVLETVTNGPWLFAKLPPGQYTVKATYKGQERTRTMELGRAMKVAMFHWLP
jgi:hypothetical protein